MFHSISRHKFRTQRCASTVYRALSLTRINAAWRPSPVRKKENVQPQVAEDSLNTQIQIEDEFREAALKNSPRARRGRAGVILALGITAINGYVWYNWQVASVRATRGNDKVLKYMMDHFMCSRRNLNEGRWWTLVTSGFSHITGSHILFNTLGIVSFMPSVAMSMGVTRCLFAYLASITGGSMAHLYHYGEWRDQYQAQSQRSLFGGLSNQPQKQADDPALGASAGLFGIFTIAMICAPTATVGIFFIPFPAWLAWGLLTGVDSYCALSPAGRQKMTQLTGIQMGHEAHLGGSATGMLSTLLLMPRFWFRR